MLTLDEINEITTENGLSTSQIDELRKKYGTNTMTPPVREPSLETIPKKIQ